MNQTAERILSGDIADDTSTGPRASFDLRRAFDASPTASLVVAEEGVLIAANQAACQLFRIAARDFAAVPVGQLLPGLVRGTRVAADAVRASPFSQMVCRRVDGSEVLARVRIATLEPSTYVVTVDDLALSGASTDAEPGRTALEETLAQRTAELAAANAEFESFTSAAGHDLRGPLRVLNGFTEALADECGESLNEEGKTFLAEILKASARMEDLVDGLVALSRSGRAEMHCELLDISTLVDLVFYECRNENAARAVESVVDPGITAWGDVRLIMAVLRDLIGNAWKFTARTEGARVHVGTEWRDGRQWICVTDNGAGFDPAHAQRLFKPFARLHRHDEFTGHGLGLAAVRRIVARHGGDTSADSEPGVRTTFRFWLAPARD